MVRFTSTDSEMVAELDDELAEQYFHSLVEFGIIKEAPAIDKKSREPQEPYGIIHLAKSEQALYRVITYAENRGQEVDVEYIKKN